MAELKSYSCPKCGSILNVDRNQDTLDCPFCGGHFDAFAFHGEELSEQARDLLIKKDYKQAREKYEYLLSKKPDEFEYLYGYACALGGLETLDEKDSPKRFNIQLAKLLNSDTRYRTGPAAPYFAKLLEMYNIYQKERGMIEKSKNLREDAKSGMRDVLRERDKMNSGLVVYAAIHWFIFGPALFFLMRGNLDGPAIPFLIAVWIFIPIFIYLISSEISDKEREVGTPEEQAELMPYHEMNQRSDKLENGIRRLEHEYANAHRMLANLKPDSAFSGPEEKEAKKAEKNEAFICKTCGADLELDKVRRLYVCAHCGATYDYGLFVGNNLSKANALLKNREFDLAAQWFSKMLDENPANFEANRGSILCAGNWTRFVEIRPNDKLADIDWDAVEAKVNSAIRNTEDPIREHFGALMVLLNKLKDCYDANVKLKEHPDDPDIVHAKNSLSIEYDRLHRQFLDADSKLKARIAGELNDEPDSMFSFRMRIIKGGKWISIDLIDPADPFDPELKDKVDAVIRYAKTKSEGEFYEYFDLWEKFVNLLSAYSQFKQNLSRYRIENEIKLRMNSQEDTYEWNVFSKRVDKYDADDKRYRLKYNAIQKKLNDLDTKLFYGESEN